jgi:hypothetical protein
VEKLILNSVSVENFWHGVVRYSRPTAVDLLNKNYKRTPHVLLSLKSLLPDNTAIMADLFFFSLCVAHLCVAERGTHSTKENNGMGGRGRVDPNNNSKHQQQQKGQSY